MLRIKAILSYHEEIFAGQPLCCMFYMHHFIYLHNNSHCVVIIEMKIEMWKAVYAPEVQQLLLEKLKSNPTVLMVYSYFYMQGMGNTEAKSNCEKWSFADEIPIVTGRRKWKSSLRETPSMKVTKILQEIKTHWETISIIKDTFLATTPEEHNEVMSYGALKFLNTNICNRHVIIIKDIW